MYNCCVHILRTFCSFTSSLIMEWFWSFSEHIYLWTMSSPLFFRALTSSTRQKADQTCDKTCPRMDSRTPPPSPPKSRITVTWGRRHNHSNTTTAANKGIFASPDASGRGQPFLLLYLPCRMGEEPVSSVYCCQGR